MPHKYPGNPVLQLSENHTTLGQIQMQIAGQPGENLPTS
jgi:hypothetical protein